MKSVSEIRKLISNNFLEAAFTEMHKLLLATNALEDLLVLENRYNDLSSKALTTSFNQRTNENSLIVSEMLRLLRNYESGSIAQNPKNNAGHWQTGKNKILYIYSNPKNKIQLDFGNEIRKIKRALQSGDTENRNKIEFQVEEAVEARELFRIIRKHKPNILHISMHASRTKGMLFQNETGNEHPITSDEFADFFELEQNRRNLECAIFSACNSLDIAKAVVQHTLLAVGMQDFIPDEAAIAFARGFYESIFDGENIEYAYKLGKLAIKIEKMQPDGKIPVHEIPVLLKQKLT